MLQVDCKLAFKDLFYSGFALGFLSGVAFSKSMVSGDGMMHWYNYEVK